MNFTIKKHPSGTDVKSKTFFTLVFFTLLLFSSNSKGQDIDPVVLGYFPSWSETWTSPGNNSPLREIPSHVNHVFLSFAKPNLTYVQGSYDIATTGIQTPYDGCTLKETVNVLNDRGVKVILSIGGETYWNSPDAYNIDYQQIKDLVDDMGFAGIDWDYEPNGSFSEIGSATNVQHFIDFITNSRALMPSADGYIIACAPSGVGALGGTVNDDPGAPFSFANRNTLTGESDDNLYNATTPTNGINMFGFSATGHMIPVFNAVGDDIDLVAYQGYNLGASTNRTLMYDAFAYYAEIHGFQVAAGVHFPNEPWGPYYTYTHINVASLSTHITNDPNRIGDGDGIMIWQLLMSGDGASAYSYMNVASAVLNGDTEENAIENANNYSMEIYTGGSEIACFCTAPDPNLGSDQSICGLDEIELISGVDTQDGVTFTWIHDENTIVSSSPSQNTLIITEPGTYKVEVEEDDCSNSDIIIITNNLPTFSLGADINICGLENTVLNTGLSDPSYTFAWTLDGNDIPDEISNTYTATSSGSYEVTVSAPLCSSSSDNIVVSDNLPDFNLGSALNLCSPTTADLNTGFTNPAYSYAWTIDGELIPDASANSYTVASAGTYEVTVSAEACSSVSSGIIITSSLPEVANDTICSEGIVNLLADEILEWYDAEFDGTLLHTGPSYSPEISSNSSFWVQAAGNIQSYSTMRASFQGDGWQQAGNVYGTKIDVLQELTLDEVTVNAQGGSVVFNIVSNDGVSVVESINFPSVTGLTALPLGITLNPGTYYMNTIGSSSNLYTDVTPDSDFETPGLLIVEGEAYWDWGSPPGANYVLSGDYGTFANLIFSTGIECDRVMVEGIIDSNYPDCDCEGLSSSSSLVEEECDSYNAPSGAIFTETGLYTDIIPNMAGCDSIISIDLTINTSTTGIDTQTSCDSFTWIDGVTYFSDNNTATFTIEGGNSNSCDSIVTLNLTVNSVDLGVSVSDPMLTADATGASYQWLNCPDMTFIDGATDQSYTATADGEYAVIVTENACTDTSECYLVNVVGIIENDFGKDFLLYPNPTLGEFSIDLGEKHQTVNIDIRDITGRLVHSEIYSDRQMLKVEFDEAAGIYLLTIQSENKKASARLVKSQ